MTQSPQNIGASVSRFAQRVYLILLMREATRWTAYAAFAWGAAALIVRMTARTSTNLLAWGAIGIIAALGIAALRAWRQRPSHAALCAALDNLNQCGGLLVTSAYSDLGAWASQVRQAEVPNVRWAMGSMQATLLASLLFLAGCLWLPLPTGDAEAAAVAALADVKTAIDEKIDLLQDQGLLPKDKADELRLQLDATVTRAKPEDLMRTWEALDHLEQMLADTAKTKAAKQRESLADLSTLASLADKLVEMASDSSSSSSLQQAMTELAKMAAANDQWADMPASLQSNLLAATTNNTVSPEQLAMLADALRNMSQLSVSNLAMLQNADMLDAKDFQLCTNAMVIANADLVEFCKGQGNGLTAVAVAVAAPAPPGQGDEQAPGPWRRNGPGTPNTTLSFDEPSPEAAAKFAPKTLTPRALADLKDSMLAGRGSRAPDEPTVLAPVTHGALNAAAAGTGAANRQRVLPRHQQSVTTYFSNHDDTK